MRRKDFPYLYETHMHTSNSSACAHGTGEEMARAAREKGYTGIIITDHSWYGNHCIDNSLGWEEWIEAFCKGYESAKEQGKEIGLDVFFGYESGYSGTEFLIYGVDKSWLKMHPEIKEASIAEQYTLIHEAGGMVIQAHPFRTARYISAIRLFPKDVDGVEGINATHSNHFSIGHYNPKFDEQAVAYARENHLPMTAGSDIHETLLLGGGMAFRRRLHSIKDFCQAVMGEEDYLLTNGDVWFDKNGRQIRN